MGSGAGLLSAQSAPEKSLDPRWTAVGGAAVLSLTAAFTKLADTTSATTVFYRCLIAAVPLAFLAMREISRRGAPEHGDMGLYVLAGALLGIDFATWTQSVAMVGAGIGTVLNNAQALAVPLLAWVFFRERIPMRFVIALPVMFAGLAMAGGALGGDSSADGSPLVGTALGLVSGIAYAGYIVIVGSMRSGSRPYTQVLVSTVAAGVVGTAVATVWGGIDIAPGLESIGWLVALALGGQMLGWLLIGTALPALSAPVGASLLLLQPALAVLIAMVLLHERPTSLQLVGCVLVVAVVGAVSMSPRPRRGGGLPVLPER
ncbi:DMT family transporter [Nocardia sp. NPDC058499]|uniref:DMT family transporter n=1 Tax=Nocardia sp. NPDC058499 TaxID=3346530 RepID=UPI00364C0B5C